MTSLPTIGVDAELLARWEQPDLRLFTGPELELGQQVPCPQEFFAGRWCAKEAVVKAAWPHEQLTPRDVEILADAADRPTATLLLPTPGPIHIDVSISHSADSPTAVATVQPL